MTDLDEVRSLERLRLAATLSGDWNSLAEYLDEGLIYIHSIGRVDSKATYLAALNEHLWTYEAIDILDERHVVSGPDLVVLFQRLSVRIRVGSDPVGPPREAIASSVWCRRDGNWRLVLVQSTSTS